MIESYFERNKWRIKIKEEEWEFRTYEEFKQTLDGLVARKNEFGKSK